MHYQGTMEFENTWFFGTSPNSEGFTKNNLCWDRLAYHGDAIAMIGQDCEPLSFQDKKPYFVEF